MFKLKFVAFRYKFHKSTMRIFIFEKYEDFLTLTVFHSMADLSFNKW